MTDKAEDVIRNLEYLRDEGGDRPIATSALALIASQAAEIAKLQAFKDYTHQRMDELNVPHEVPSPHTDAGCRIGGRFDFVAAEIARLRGLAATVYGQDYINSFQLPKLDIETDSGGYPMQDGAYFRSCVVCGLGMNTKRIDTVPVHQTCMRSYEQQRYRGKGPIEEQHLKRIAVAPEPDDSQADQHDDAAAKGERHERHAANDQNKEA